MTRLSDNLARLMARELETFAREVELFPDDTTLWQTLPGVSNSAGNLALHVCGNLRHFVGAVLGQTGYVRQRELEFSTREGRRVDVAAALRETAVGVREVLAGVPAATLEAQYPEGVNGFHMPCDRFLTHLAVHLGLHLGQAGYLRRALSGDATSAGPVPLAALVD